MKPCVAILVSLLMLGNGTARASDYNSYHTERDSLREAEAAVTLAAIAMAAIAYGGIESTAAMGDGSGELLLADEDIVKQVGTPRLAYFRADITRLDTSSTDSNPTDYLWDYRLHAGWGPAAAEYRLTEYMTDEEGERTNLQQAYLLYRMSYFKHIEWHLGVGALGIEGSDDQVHTSSAICSPVRVHLPHVSIEFLNSWGEIDGQSIQDRSLSALGHIDNIGIRAGYRWIQGPDEFDTRGAFVGMSFFW